MCLPTLLETLTLAALPLLRFGDHIVDISSSLSSRLLSNLSLVITHSYIHEAVPPPGALRDDQRLGVVLRVSL